MLRVSRFILLASLAAPGVWAATTPQGPRKVTVAQLEQALSVEQGKPDAEAAQALSQLELSERLSFAKLAHWQAAFPGEKARQELQALADASVFFNLPAAEVPASPAPDPAVQRQIMGLVVSYVTKSIHQLPNFLATRETTRFEDRPQQEVQQSTSLLSYGYLPLHFVGKSSAEVVYREGQEVVDTGAGKTRKLEPGGQGLVSYGEFGPILSTVLLDAAESKLEWSHWETGASGQEAVFHYRVPAQKSHYWVQFCCVSTESDPAQQFRKRAGYHGEMAVDPATGTILRVTLEADLAVDEPLTRAAMMVEYAPTEIGGQTFICPVRSVALSRVHFAAAGWGMHAAAIDQGPVKSLLNHVDFAQYHRLGSEVRILAQGELPDAAGATRESAGQQQTSVLSAEKPATVTGGAASQPEPPEAKPLASAQVVPEIIQVAASGVPVAPADASIDPLGSYVLKVASRLVDVGVTVTDKKGRATSNLNAQDFSLFDEGRKQQIKYFTQPGAEVREATNASTEVSPSPERKFSNQPESAESATPAVNSTVLLIDESHTAWSDLSHARGELLNFLTTLAPGERVGLYSITGTGFRVLTEITPDHPAVVARLRKWMPTAQSMVQAQEDENRNRQHFETVRNAADLKSVNGNQEDEPDGSSPVDPQLLTLGSNPGRASLIILRAVARHLASLPGHKNLVWVASDNVFVDWTDKNAAFDKNPSGVEAYAVHAQEAMNDAHVSVYPFDLSQLEAGTVGADLQNRNVELSPLAKGATNASHDLTAGRAKAAMLQDLRPIQGAIRQVASATGGRILRRSGDLALELEGIVEEGHAVYQLSFSPDTPADNKYHSLTVNLVDKKGLTPRYRSGYLYAKEPETLKDRFQQAIWRPMDANEIHVTASVGPEASGVALKINIAANNLDLQQQAGRWTDRLDIFLVQRDDAGLHAQVEGQALGLRLLPASYKSYISAGIPFEHTVKVAPGTGSLRVLVVDENSGRMGSVTIPAPALSAQQ